MSRILKIKNFRNIGLEEEQKLIINYSLEKGKMGNVIYLLGANNSGKSNILDAFLIYHSNNLQKNRDKTNLFRYNNKEVIPEISLEISYKENKQNNLISGTVKLNHEKSYLLNDNKSYNFTENQLNNVIQKIQDICSGDDDEEDELTYELEQIKNSKTIDYKVSNLLLLLKKIQSNYSDYNYSRYNSRMAYSQIFSQI